MLLRGDRPEWKNSLKSMRREFIAANYRIVALVGDDLGDFVDPKVFAGDRERLGATVRGELVPAAESHVRLAGPIPTARSNRSTRACAPTAPVLELPGIGPWRADAARVRIASWNVEYLMTAGDAPGTARRLRRAGRHGGRR